ncbi:hypothetical protein HAX54_038122 [Datura stramonium]|uniref:Uncharacterized protein n=1 Tax=Datura stramonium TaxID=4076 RepID=A0ABS8VJE4_DATST|nr:hypothetical protein [Datura stramonium]
MLRAIAALAQAHVELRADMEKDKRKRLSHDKQIMCMWKGIKNILKILTLNVRTPQRVCFRETAFTAARLAMQSNYNKFPSD